MGRNRARHPQYNVFSCLYLAFLVSRILDCLKLQASDFRLSRSPHNSGGCTRNDRIFSASTIASIRRKSSSTLPLSTR